MMMSIYERTKEIGVIKVLGCSLRNIKQMFLLEAGFIGFIGGVVGNILSFMMSFAINVVTATWEHDGNGRKYFVYTAMVGRSIYGVCSVCRYGSGIFPGGQSNKIKSVGSNSERYDRKKVLIHRKQSIND